MSRKVNYFEAQRIAPNRDNTTLSVIVSDYIPTTLSALETRSSRSFWITDEDFARAYNEIKRQQWELLMDATDRIINEIRAIRQGDNTPENFQDPTLNPYSLGLTSLEDIQFNLQDNNGTLAQIAARQEILLGEIKTILENQAAGEGSELEALLQIVALLSV